MNLEKPFPDKKAKRDESGLPRSKSFDDLLFLQARLTDETLREKRLDLNLGPQGPITSTSRTKND